MSKSSVTYKYIKVKKMADTDNNIQNNPPIDPNKPNKVYPWKRHDYMVPDHREKHIPQDNYCGIQDRFMMEHQIQIGLNNQQL